MPNELSGQSSKGIETRRTPRRVYMRPVGLLFHGDYFLAQAIQISEGGLLFQTDKELRIKEQLVVSLVMPGGVCIVTRGELLYDRPGSEKGFKHFGMRFKELQLHQRRMVRNYVSAKTEKEAAEETDE